MKVSKSDRGSGAASNVISIQNTVCLSIRRTGFGENLPVWIFNRNFLVFEEASVLKNQKFRFASIDEGKKS